MEEFRRESDPRATGLAVLSLDAVEDEDAVTATPKQAVSVEPIRQYKPAEPVLLLEHRQFEAANAPVEIPLSGLVIDLPTPTFDEPFAELPTPAPDETPQPEETAIAPQPFGWAADAGSQPLEPPAETTFDEDSARAGSNDAQDAAEEPAIETRSFDALVQDVVNAALYGAEPAPDEHAEPAAVPIAVAVAEALEQSATTLADAPSETTAEEPASQDQRPLADQADGVTAQGASARARRTHSPRR